MKKFCICLVVLLMALASFAQCGGDAKPAAAPQLVFVFLNRPAQAPDYPKEKLQEIQDGHMANIRRLYGEGKMLAAGPFMDDTTLRGIFVFKAASADEVKEWLATDPAIKAGRLAGDVHPWHPAQGEVNHPTENKGMENFVMLIYRWSEKSKAIPGEEMQKAGQAHKAYQAKLFDDGKTVIGGPFTDSEPSETIGVVIARGSVADGEKLAADDPMVKAGIATVQVHPWIVGRGVLGK